MENSQSNDERWCQDSADSAKAKKVMRILLFSQKWRAGTFALKDDSTVIVIF